MASNFNPQILVDKLTKLNMSQQNIETLSHWCIFHMNKAKQVVETWDRQFHCSPREQRVCFLYLANDILQNSRRKGVEFVTEFWKVLPGTLSDVINNGDDFGKKAALRLISIWDERKVFGSRGQILKEEFLKRELENDNKSSRPPPGRFNQKSPGPTALDKLVSGYQAVYGNQLDEDTIFNKCRNAISFVDNVDKNIDGDYRFGQVNSSVADELKGQRAVLRDSIQQLKAVESSRANLVTLLRDALQEQEYKLDQVRNQLQAAQTHSEQADCIFRQLHVSSNGESLPASQAPQTFTTQEQLSTVVYMRQVSAPEKSSHSDEDPKMLSAAASVAAKFTASTSSAQMLTYVPSSLISGVIGNNDSSTSDYPSEKRLKLGNNHHVPPGTTPLPPPDMPNRDEPPPPPPSSPPPPLPPLLRPYQVPNFTHTLTAPYGYGMMLQPELAPIPSHAPVAPSAHNGVSAYASSQSNVYQSYPTEGGFYSMGQSTAPMSRQ